MRRRDFIAAFAGLAGAWPVVARAQQGERLRRIGLFMNLVVDDPRAMPRVAAFLQGLQELGWVVGRNVQIDYRWGARGDAEATRRDAEELVAAAPDVILTFGGVPTRPLLRVTRTVPIVFVGLVDPVGSGLIASLARPGGNLTGFTGPEYGTSGKWLELLKEIAPGVTRVAVMRDASRASGIGQFGSIQTVAPSLGVELSPIDLHDAGEIERVVTNFARKPHGGLIVVANTSAGVHGELIIALATKHKLPSVFFDRFYVARGGLVSYGIDRNVLSRQAAGYVDRILKGEKPADLPVQAPTKYELVINLKTAKALGLDVPPTLLASADEVIE
jgi:ABC-type uncharacterized transport system substrate-binding protein